MVQQHTRPSQYPSDPRQRVSTHYSQQPYPQHYQQPYSEPVVYPPSPSRRFFNRQRINRSQPSYSQPPVGRQKQVLVAGGSMLALATLVVAPSMNRADQGLTTGAADVCIKQVNKQSLVSRDELKAILELDANAPKTKVQEIVDQPHCVLEARAGEDGVQVEREAYPLEFDPQTWIILQYQGEAFTGFDFSFR
jgi:hypothetical protein